MKKVNSSIVVLVMLLFITVIALAGIVLYYEMDKNDVGENLDEHKEIVLSDSEKIRINTEIIDKFHVIFMDLTDLNMDGVTIENLIYNVNMLNDEKNRYYVVWGGIVSDDEFRNYLNVEKEPAGAATMEFNKVKQAYKKFLNADIDEETLLAVDRYSDSYIEDGIYYSAVPTGYGEMNYCLKANSLELNEKTGVYTLTVDVVLDKEFNIRNEKVLNWDYSLNKAQLIMQYTKSENTKTLISLVLERNIENTVNSLRAYKMGERVTLKDGSNWTVIADSPSSQNYVTVLGEKDYVEYLQGAKWDLVLNQMNKTWVEYKDSYLDRFMQSQAYRIPAELKEVDGYKIRLITLNEILAIDTNWQYNSSNGNYDYNGQKIPEYIRGVTTMTLVENRVLGKQWAFYTVGETQCLYEGCAKEYFITTWKNGLGGFNPVVNIYKDSI